MTTPPATRISLGASWWYRGAVGVVTIILIAAQAVNTWTTGLFNTQSAVLWGVAGLAIGCAWWDAWRTRRGVLHYAQGQWVLALGDIEHEGTIHAVVDLPAYLLVKFTPVGAAHPLQLAHSSYKKEYPQQCQEKWLHLEPHSKLPTAGADWLALRRAVFARHAHSDASTKASPALS
jgi:hypothetical protein